MWLRVVVFLVLGAIAIILLRRQKILYISIENFKWLVFFLIAIALLMLLGSFTGAF